MEQLFLAAARNKYRFESPTGALAFEDLWSLPLTTSVANRASLDGIAKGINHQLKSASEESFVTPNPAGTAKSKELEGKLEIVKFVIKTKLDEAAIAEKAREKAATRAKVMEIIERKENTALEGKDIAELKKMLED